MTRSEEVASAFGYLTQKEVVALKQLAGNVMRYATIVNVGSGSGTSGLAIAEVRPEAYRFTVDISAGGPLGGLENERNAFANTTLPLPVQLLGDSYVIGKNWHGQPIDLLFIDADHSCEGVTRDLQAWLPNLNQSAIVAFHDYESPHWPCVKAVVDQAMKDKHVILHVDTLIGFYV